MEDELCPFRTMRLTISVLPKFSATLQSIVCRHKNTVLSTTKISTQRVHTQTHTHTHTHTCIPYVGRGAHLTYKQSRACKCGKLCNTCTSAVKVVAAQCGFPCSMGSTEDNTPLGHKGKLNKNLTTNLEKKEHTCHLCM